MEQEQDFKEYQRLDSHSEAQYNPHATMANEFFCMPKIVVGGKYRLLAGLGYGCCGEIYRAVDMLNNDEVAIKLESSSVKNPQLPHEAEIYNLLQGGVGFPRARHYCTQGIYNVLVMDLLGPSLEDLFNICERRFSLKTTTMLAYQILTRVEYLHMKCLLHCDIKPEDFLMGLGSQRNCVFMIDFGLSKRYYNPHTRTHVPYNECQEFVGEPLYASVNAHHVEPGRRDDLESVGYMLIYFLCGRLPWQGIVADTRQQRCEKIAEIKSALPLETLCSGLSTEFYIYLKYCRCLLFTDQPDYLYLRQLFKVLFRRRLLVYDYRFDWEVVNVDWPNNKNRRMDDQDDDEQSSNSFTIALLGYENKHNRGKNN